MKKILSSFALALTLAVSALAQSPSAFIPVPQGSGLAARGSNGQDIAVIGIDGNNDTSIFAPSGEQIVAKIAGTPAVTLSSTTTTIAGNQAVSGTLTVTGATSTGSLTVKAAGDANRLHVFGGSSDTALTYTFGDGSTSGQILSIVNASADGADNGSLKLSGGGAIAAGRGANVQLFGNESASFAGAAYILSGDIAGADIVFSAIDQVFVNPGQVQSAEFLANGNIYFNNTTSVGWTLGTGANTVCNTTCTYACILGQDTDAASKPIVACNDATADRCLCAGPS